MNKPFKVLIVANEAERELVYRSVQLVDVSTEIVAVREFASAIASIHTGSFDCIFLGTQFLSHECLTLVEAVQKSGTQSHLIALIEQSDDLAIVDTLVDILKAGVSDYVIKDLTAPLMLQRVLQNSIRLYEAEQKAEIANHQLRESNELLKRKNQELERQQQMIQLQNLQLLEVSRLKSQFLSIMSHELRTPLNVIMGFAQILMRRSKGPLTQQQVDMTERILSNSRQLQKLIDEILDFSKIGADRIDLVLEEFDLVQVIQSTVNTLKPLARQKELALTLSLRIDDGVIVNDRKRIRQILSNLISNAIKFTSKGKVEVNVSQEDKETIAIVVRDTGVGIASDHLDHIFEPFRQIDQSTTRKYSGTGLGLAITALLVKMMHGQITVESNLNQGSMFRVEIPRHVPLLSMVPLVAKPPLPKQSLHIPPIQTSIGREGVASTLGSKV